MLLIAVFAFSLVGQAEEHSSSTFEPEGEVATIGSGGGKIHVIPSIHPYSLKNGEKLTVRAIVKSEEHIASVVANLGGVAQIELKPDQALGGTDELLSGHHAGVFTNDWTATGLEERVYSVTLTVTDVSGNTFSDSSLAFSDPAAGNSTPGTTNYPSGGMSRLGAVSGYSWIDEWNSAVIDPLNGYAYLGSPGRIVKVALGSENNPPTRVGVLQLDQSEQSRNHSAVIDVANGFAYFGNSGRVVKVALGIGNSLPTRIGAATLNSGEGILASAVIDAANGYAYFGTSSSPGRVVKVALGAGGNPPNRIGAVTLDNGENDLQCAVIDAASGYAYLGTYDYGQSIRPGKVVKVALGNGDDIPSRVGALPFNVDEYGLRSAVIDTTNGYAYFATELSSTRGRIVKVALGNGNSPPSRVGSVTLNVGEYVQGGAVIDTTNSRAFFGLGGSPGRVVKISLGTGNNPPTRVAIASFSSSQGENGTGAGIIDIENGYCYFTTGNVLPSRLVKLELGSVDGPPVRIAALNGELFGYSFTGFSGGPDVSAIDTVNGYAYFGMSGTSSTPGRVVKMALGGSLPTFVAQTGLANGENMLLSMVIDATRGNLYIGTSDGGSFENPGRVVKLTLGAGNNPPMRLGSLTLNSGEYNLQSAVIDTTNRHAYFGARGDFRARVVKVALGFGSNLPTRIGTLTLDEGDGSESPLCAVIDATNGFAYFGCERIVKVALGSGTTLPIRVGSADLEVNEGGYKDSAVIDVANGYAYFATRDSFQFRARVVKIALGSGNDLPIRTGAVTLDSGSGGYLASAVIDAAGGYAYWGTDAFGITGRRVERVRLGSGDALPTHEGTLDLLESNLQTAIIDPARGFAYFGGVIISGGQPSGQISKVALSQAGTVNGTRFNMPEAGSINSVRFYSHSATGNLRLALYDDGEPKNLLWQSASVPNNALNSDVVIPVSTGIPTILNLEPGTYWLAWQVDTSAPIGSYTAATFGESFRVAQPFGSAPDNLSSGAIATTNERWTIYITYTIPSGTTGIATY